MDSQLGVVWGGRLKVSGRGLATQGGLGVHEGLATRVTLGRGHGPLVTVGRTQKTELRCVIAFHASEPVES